MNDLMKKLETYKGSPSYSTQGETHPFTGTWEDVKELLFEAMKPLSKVTINPGSATADSSVTYTAPAKTYTTGTKKKNAPA